jgi:hypothetical protein
VSPSGKAICFSGVSGAWHASRRSRQTLRFKTATSAIRNIDNLFIKAIGVLTMTLRDKEASLTE